MAAVINEQTITLNGLQVHYYTAGTQGSAVVLLHGGGTDSAMLSWRKALPVLAEGHRVYAPNWPGYGQSQIFPEGGYSFTQMTGWLERLMAHWGLERASLVGISMGGGGALAYTLANPQQVERLVLVDSYGLARLAPSHKLSYLMVRMPWLMDWSWAWARKSKERARWSLQSIFADKRNITDELADEVYEAIKDPSAGRAFAEFQRAELGWKELKTCFIERIDEIRSPTLIIHGEKDSLVPLADSQKAARKIANARLEVVANAGHWPMREQPEVFNRLVEEFLAD